MKQNFARFTLSTYEPDYQLAPDTYNEFGILSCSREKEEKLALEEWLALIPEELITQHPEKVEKAYKIGLSPGFVIHALTHDLEISAPGSFPARALDFLETEEDTEELKEERARKEKVAQTSLDTLLSSMSKEKVVNLIERMKRRKE